MRCCVATLNENFKKNEKNEKEKKKKNNNNNKIQSAIHLLYDLSSSI